MESNSLPDGHSNEMTNEEMGFVTEKNPIKTFSSLPGYGCSWWPSVKPFVNGGLAYLAADTTFLGLAFASFHYVVNLAKQDKVLAAELKNVLYSAESRLKLQSGTLLFRATATALVIGSNEILTRQAVAANGGIPPSIYQETYCALLAGYVGARITGPVQFANYHVIVDSSLPAAKHHKFRNIFEAARHIGVKELWKGGSLFVKPHTAFYAGMLFPYKRSFDYFWGELGFDGTRAQLGASVVSGFFAAACTTPFYNVSLHMLRAKLDANQRYAYKSSLECASKILKARGFSGFFRGFPWFFVSQTPRFMVFWVTLEKLGQLENSIGW